MNDAVELVHKHHRIRILSRKSGIRIECGQALSVIISRGNHATYGEDDILENTEKQPICIMEPGILAEHKNIDCQVSEVSVAPYSSLSERLDFKLKELPPHLEYVFLKQKSK